AGRQALVGHGVGQRVGLDDRYDADAAVLGVAQDRNDGVYVLRLVLGQTGRGSRNLSVGRQRRAVAPRQVVDDDLEDLWRAALLLGQRVVQLRLQAPVRAVAGDRPD